MQEHFRSEFKNLKNDWGMQPINNLIPLLLSLTIGSYCSGFVIVGEVGRPLYLLYSDVCWLNVLSALLFKKRRKIANRTKKYGYFSAFLCEQLLEC